MDWDVDLLIFRWGGFFTYSLPSFVNDYLVFNLPTLPMVGKTLA